MSDFSDQFRQQFENNPDDESSAPETEDKEPNPTSPKEQEVQQKTSQQKTSSGHKNSKTSQKVPPSQKNKKPPHTNIDMKKEISRIRKNFFSGVRKKHSHQNQKKKHGLIASFLLFCSNIIVILGIVVLVRTFLFSPFSVSGPSMESTLSDKSLIIVDKLSYRFSEPDRGDIIVFHPPIPTENASKVTLLCRGKRILAFVLRQNVQMACNEKSFFVKRIIGIPGDTVEIRNTQVFVTPALGEKTLVREDFLDEKNKKKTCISRFCDSKKDAFPVFFEVPENSLFILGDNRTGSSDSRAWSDKGYSPYVPYESVSGKVKMSIWPLSKFSFFSEKNILSK